MEDEYAKADALRAALAEHQTSLVGTEAVTVLERRVSGLRDALARESVRREQAETQLRDGQAAAARTESEAEARADEHVQRYVGEMRMDAKQMHSVLFFNVFFFFFFVFFFPFLRCFVSESLRPARPSSRAGSWRSRRSLTRRGATPLSLTSSRPSCGSARPRNGCRSPRARRSASGG
jgi:hypothetical protein